MEPGSILPATFLLAAGSLLVTRVAVGSLMAPVTFYWIGWLLGIFAAESMGGDGVFPPFTEYSRVVIMQANIGAAIGFSMAAVMYRSMLTATGGQVRTVQPAALHIDDTAVWIFTAIQAALGIWLLRSMIAAVQGIGGAISLIDIRALYLDRAHMVSQMHPMARLGSHLNLFWTVFPFLFGLSDAIEGRIRWRRLLLWWLAGVPAGLATGGRGWIIATPLTYGATYLSTSGYWLLPVVRRVILRGVVAVVLMIALFGLIDRLRSWRYEETNPIAMLSDEMRWYDQFKPIKPVVFYLGFPVLAAGAYAEYAETIEPYNGTLTAQFFGAQLARLGLVDRNPLEFLVNSRNAVRRGPFPVFGFTHATAVPLVIGDVGFGLTLPVMIIFTCLVQLGYYLLRNGGIIARLVSVHMLLYGGFWMFQDSLLGTAGGVLPVLWLAAFIVADRCAVWAGLRSSPILHLDRGPGLPATPLPVPA